MKLYIFHFTDTRKKRISSFFTFTGIHFNYEKSNSAFYFTINFIV